VVLGIGAVHGAHERAHRQVESWGAELALVAAGREEVEDAGTVGEMLEHVLGDPVGERVPAPGALVRERCGVARARHDIAGDETLAQVRAKARQVSQ